MARYYDPVVGLFLSADTVQSNLLGFNPYAYVGENSETMTDPTGHDSGWYGTLAVMGMIAALAVTAVAVTALVVAATATAPVWLPIAATIAIGASVGVWSAGAGSFLNYTYAHGGNVWNNPRAFDDWGKQALVAEGVGMVVGGGVAALGFAFPAIPLLGTALGTIAGGLGGIIGNAVSNAIFPNTHPSPIDLQPQQKTAQNQQLSTIKSSGSSTFSAPTQSTPTRYTPTAPTQTSTNSNSRQFYYTVVSGDSLWAIAARFLGSGLQWQRIYQENIGVIGNNPNLIFPGERLTIH